MNFDIIVIGAGIGGLTAASALAKTGKSVLIVESHDRLGGYLQSFKRGKWRWNVGMHYVGEMSKDSSTFKVLSSLTNHSVDFTPLDDTFEINIFPDSTHHCLSNYDQMEQMLIAEFPHERMNIIRYGKLLEKIGQRRKMLIAPRMIGGKTGSVLYKAATLSFRSIKHKTVAEVFDSYFTDERLKTYLSIHCGKTMLSPKELSFLSYAFVLNSYKKGGYYPVGGGESIIKGFQKVLHDHRVVVMTKERVTEILFDRKRACGIRLEDGREFTASQIISSIGMNETYSKLIPLNKQPQKYKELLSLYKNTRSYISLFIGFEGDISSFNLPNANFRIMSDSPFDFSGNLKDDEMKINYATITVTSMRDPLHTDHLHHEAHVLIPVDYSIFTTWKNTSLESRTPEYESVKYHH